MELFGLLIFIYVIFRLLAWILPGGIFTSNSSFLTGLWVWLWSTQGFRKLVKALLLSFIFVFLFAFISALLHH